MSDGKEVKPSDIYVHHQTGKSFVLVETHDRIVAELRAELTEAKAEVERLTALSHNTTTELRDLSFLRIKDLEETIARQAREAEVSKAVIEKLNSRLAAFVEYFDAIKNGEYQKNRPFLRDFEEVLLLRGQEVLNELAAIERAEGEKEHE